VAVIASMYRQHPFHNFENASHVAMSVRKLLSGIISPDNPIHAEQQERVRVDARLSMDDRTYGITSDKLAQFAVAFSALIHDVDHPGMPNFCLAKEDPAFAEHYKHKAIAEHNSVSLGWDVLMRPEFDQLRACIYTSASELLRFRQLVVNTIIATDIFDPDLAQRRMDRWKLAFESEDDVVKTLDDVSRKAAIVFEHLIQASDIAHTMQHWQVFVKWNERLFQEMVTAYRQGRLPQDPSIHWYTSELSFFENYIIPLAKKLKDCGVFGVSKDEYLNYALQNRKEWCVRGEKIVEEMKQRFEEKEGALPPSDV
jgi:hypothetical protein